MPPLTLLQRPIGKRAWAIASLVLGIVSIAGGACFIVPPIVAIIVGGMALRKPRLPHSNGIAIAGLILGTASLVLSILFWASVIKPR